VSALAHAVVLWAVAAAVLVMVLTLTFA